MPERTKALVQLGRDKVYEFQKAPARNSVSDYEPRLGALSARY
jgi:hypothetical protein